MQFIAFVVPFHSRGK